MYEESESERYRKKLKDEYEEFALNQDVYKTLLDFSKSTYKMIIETALQAFHCGPEDLQMDELKELEVYLKRAKKNYHLLVTAEENATKIVISDEEDPEDPEPIPELEIPPPVETNWRMPREIPSVTNNMDVNNVQPYQQPAVNNNPYGYNPPWNPWMNYSPVYGMTSNIPRPPQFQLLQPSMPQFNLSTSTSPAFIYNQSSCPLPPISHYSHHNNPLIPSTSRQIAPEKPAAPSYREHRLMKKREEEAERKRIMQNRLLLKKQEEQKQERERNMQREQDQQKKDDKIEKVSSFFIRRQQVADYKKRECDQQASTSSKKSETEKSQKSEGIEKKKKSVTWADDISLNNNNGSSDVSADKASSSSKAQSEKAKNKTEKPKKPKKDPKFNAKKIEDAIKKALTPDMLLFPSTAQKPGPSTAKKPDSNTRKTDKNPKNKEDEGKIKKLKVIHAKPIFKLLKHSDGLIKRKSNSPVKDDQKAKRPKEDNNINEPINSNCDIIKETEIEIKEEILSDDDNMDGKTDVSSNGDNETEPLQKMESDRALVKQEPGIDMDDTASTFENVDIKQEIMSEIDQENSSVHSEKLEVNDITESFVNICENPELLNTIAENFIDFSQFENLTDAVNNNSQGSQMDSQDKCASWLEDINNQDEQFYLTKDEEAEPDDDIVPYYPVRNLGAPEIVPKEEEQ
ncbi:hypothetical protein ACKWTF_003155 [Chironomus riparius]